MKTDYIFALDFDGVICDSARETAASGWKAGQALWPERFSGDIPQTLTDQFCAVRPVLKTGYESILLLRLLMEGNSVNSILSAYLPLKKALLAQLETSEDSLKAQFGAVRDAWIDHDLQSWLQANGFYDGTVEAVNRCPFPVYIVTTKQQRFAEALCNVCGITLPPDHIFGLESGPKIDTLAKLMRSHPKSTLLFVEDNIQSLLYDEFTKLDSVRRIFAKWGYSTPENRNTAECAQNITPISLDEFADLLSNPRKFFA